MALNKIVYIYGLFDPITCHLKYIGKSVNPHNRLKQHVKESQTGNTHKDNWIRKLFSKGLQPTIEILEICSSKNWKKAEKVWIKECRKNGIDLVNVLEGGTEPPNLRDLPNREEIIKKMSTTRKAMGIKPPGFKGMKHSDDSKQKQSISISAYYRENDHPFKGKNLTEEHKENIVKAWKDKGIYGKNWMAFVSDKEIKESFKKRNNNPNWRKNMSKSAKKRMSNPENNPMFGKNHSEDSKSKNRLSNLMYTAYRKDDYLLLAELQQEYFELFGCYQPAYAEFLYQ